MALALSRDNLAYLDDVELSGQVSAIAGVETTIINHTVPPNEVHILNSVHVGGKDNAVFFVKINGAELIPIRNNWTDRTKEHSLGSYRIFAGDNLVVSVINYGIASNTFEARVNAKKL